MVLNLAQFKFVHSNTETLIPKVSSTVGRKWNLVREIDGTYIRKQIKRVPKMRKTD